MLRILIVLVHKGVVQLQGSIHCSSIILLQVDELGFVGRQTDEGLGSNTSFTPMVEYIVALLFKNLA